MEIPIKKLVRKALLSTLWMTVVLFPLMVIKADTINEIIEFRWAMLPFIILGCLIMSSLWHVAIYFRDNSSSNIEKLTITQFITEKFNKIFPKKSSRLIFGISLIVIALILPFFLKLNQLTIMNKIMRYLLLGLGLNIIVGMGGILHLGYIAFYAVGAYTYGILYEIIGISFWIALPLGGIVGGILGILTALPVLRLRGDYLAIVTLALGFIVKIILENLDITHGASGISQIGRPEFFGLDMNITSYFVLFFIINLFLIILVIKLIKNLECSRIGRALVAMREDEIATQAMGINLSKMKIISFAMGGVIAGVAGVVMASSGTFISPRSFELWESVIVLCIVVIGGIGSIPGVVVGSVIIIYLPELLRVFKMSQFRMLFFGLLLVAMMIFKPDGFIPAVRKKYKFKKTNMKEVKNA